MQIPEAPIQDLSHCSPTGYARAKLIAERMIEKAASSAGASATILRIGQIVPSRTSGSRLWNPNEMVPLLVRSGLTTGVLPDRPGGSDGCSWIDVDVLSRCILEIGSLAKGPEQEQNHESPQLVYNLVHPNPFSWASDFLPALRSAGLDFETVSWDAWLRKLDASEKDVGKNPSRKLLGFWEQGSKGVGKREVVFETSIAQRKSESLRTAEGLIKGDNVKELLAAWHKIW